MNDRFRYLIGYSLGLALFFGLVPAAMLALWRWVPLPFALSFHLPADMRLGPAILILIIGVYFALSSNIALKRIGHGGPTDGFGIAVTPRTRHLVTVGPYRYTRNPMAFGAWLCYLALSLFLDAPVLLALWLLLVPGILRYLRRYEERRLLADFGAAYEAYRTEVPMFFPRFTNR